MLKKAALALFGLILAIGLISPSKAAAEVNVGVAIGAPGVYGAVNVAPAPYVDYPEPYVYSNSEPYVYSQPYVTYQAPVSYGAYYSGPYWRHDHGCHRGWRDRDDDYGYGRGRWHRGRW